MPGIVPKPWRAYSELDGLSDAECRELVERRWRRTDPPLRVIDGAAVLAALAWAVFVPLFVGTQTAIPDDESLDEAVVVMVISTIALGGALIVGFLVRWWLLWMLTRRTLRRIVAGATCPRCKHSLIGLPIYDDATRPEDRSRMRVRCPECGKAVRLLKYGYGPEDLAPWSERVLPRDFEVRIRR